MPALDAFHVKQTIWEHTIHSEYWHGYADHFMRSLAGEYANEPDAAIGDPRHTETGAQFDRRMRTTMELSETFYVAPLMNRLVTAAAEAWPEDEKIHAEDFPVDHGFMYVPGGLTMVDVRGRTLTTEVLTWSIRGATVHFVYWMHKKHDPPPLRRPGWDDMPDWTPWHVSSLTLGETLPQTLQLGKVLPPEISKHVQWVTGPDGNLVGFFPQGWAPEDLAPGIKPDGVIAWLVSALRIMQQPLAAVERKGLPANVRRELLKKKRRLKNVRVTVIDFRRRVGDFQHGGEREYSHRFLRRGHWRRQPYKQDDGTWDHRRIWIHPTIVGDPSLPLILRDHVNALSR